MTKNVLVYARYSTDRQDDQSIETQLERCQATIAQHDWRLVDTLHDSAVSGTSYKRRPGIQQVLRRVERGGIDIVLCLSVDRLSRDVAHGAQIGKKLSYHDVEIWTARANARISDIEMHLSAVLSQETVEQGRYRTREGMRTTVQKGKAAGGIAYGYRVKQAYDERGDRIPGLREVADAEARIIIWIFEEYAKGRSPKDIAVELNSRVPAVPGPRGAKWRDTAIRGHVSRGTGILNNELYIGRVVWNRREYRKNPDSERRVARPNNQDEWVVSGQPELRIVSDALWSAVKKRQMEVEQSFSHTTTNRLNKAHRPQYLLSGILECAHCFGPYAIMAKDRYGCTNRQKKLPIDHLGGIVCTNSKTISRFELEERVVSAVPDNLLGADNLDRINRNIKAAVERGQQRALVEPEHLRGEIKTIETKQKAIGEKIAERLMAGHAAIPALDHMLDELEQQRLSLAAKLTSAPTTSTPAVSPPLNAGLLKGAIAAVKTMLSTRENGVEETWISITRQLVQKVVIAPSSGGKTAELTIHGRLAAILAAQEAWREVSCDLRHQQSSQFARIRFAGEFKSLADRTKFLHRCEALLAEREQQWMLLQVSVVAGAGFEPAAFRL
ncbi:recombinase family protein [Neorhizobium sp. DAR64861/K0K2]|uniref:recombinase family protein n=1 Tax=Neorhizobium sp. DAR64861/K0K2 TaxID=3421956 RepID=UPI003D2A06C7